MVELTRNVEELRRPRSKSEAETSKLNNALLNASSPKKEEAEPKRNSKHALIDKIMSVSEKYELDLDYSDTRLKRMNKKQLTELLTTYVEKRVEFEASKVLGLTKEQAKSTTCCNLAALRMLHQICVTSVERGVESTSSKHGMTLEGFSQKMKDSAETIDMILLEISDLYPDIISKFSSPWVRLALIWGSNAMLTLRKINTKTHNPVRNTRTGVLRL